MKRKWFRGFALALAAAMLLTACGGDKKDDSKSSGDGATTSQAEKPEGAPDTWIADRTIKGLVFQSAGDADADSMSPEIQAYIKERTGITLELEGITSEDSTKALASGLAAGDLPDFIAFYLNNSGRPEFPMLLKASNEGMFHDIAPMLKASTTYGKYFEEGYLPTDTKKNIMMREDQDGATYLVHMAIDQKAADPGNKTIGGLYVRKDIADSLGVDPYSITTSAQLQDFLKKVQAGNFVDDNGNPVTPLGPTVWGGSDRPWPYMDLVWTSAANEKFYNDGTGAQHESMTDYAQRRVKFVRQLLADGLMHPEYYTMEENRAKEGIVNGSFAVVCDMHNYTPENADMTYVPMGPINRLDGTNNMIMSYKSGYCGWAIPDTTENPEDIVKFADWLAGPEGKLLYFYGLEGKHYDLVDGKPVPQDWILKLKAEDPDAAKKEGFRGVRAFWGEHLGYTDMDNLGQFGESQWGANKTSAGDQTTAQKIIELYGYDKRYEEKTVIDGLTAKSYIYEFEGDDGSLNEALDSWDEDLLKAYYANTEEEAMTILENAAKKLQNAKIEEFCKFLDEKEASGETIFY